MVQQNLVKLSAIKYEKSFSSLHIQPNMNGTHLTDVPQGCECI